MTSNVVEPESSTHVPYATPSLSYAQPAPTYGNKVFAACGVIFAGLALMLVGGCFLIGVMITTLNTSQVNSSAPLSPSSLTLVTVLYCLAGVTFTAATTILLKGLHGLFKIMRA